MFSYACAAVEEIRQSEGQTLAGDKIIEILGISGLGRQGERIKGVSGCGLWLWAAGWGCGLGSVYLYIVV